MGALLLGILVVTTFIALRAFREPPLAAARQAPGQLSHSARLLLRNNLLLRVLASDFAVSVGQGILGYFIRSANRSEADGFEETGHKTQAPSRTLLKR